MSVTIIFLPSSLYKERECYMCGVIEHNKELGTNSYYVLCALPVSRKKFLNSPVLGYYCDSRAVQFSNSNVESDTENWLCVRAEGSDFVLSELVVSGCKFDLSVPTKVICIIYDPETFLRSELLLNQNTWKMNSFSMKQDHFITLAQLLHETFSDSQSNNDPYKFTGIGGTLMNFTLALLLGVRTVVTYLKPVFKYSTIGIHLQNFLESLCWAFNACQRGGQYLKVGNYVTATALDIVSGILILQWLLTMMSVPDLLTLLLSTAEHVVDTLQDLLHWLMGIPAGLKLNFALNNMLGNFFLYHINLWWTFLVVAKPILYFTLQVFHFFGHLGITFQVSILADLLALVSFHVYCVYVYAARLYNLEVSGLLALWRLFLGKKWNPLRGRVDSCHYTSDQLFVGTLAFTILLFLLPTTFMYYIVFTILRLAVIALGGILTRLRYLLQALPAYVTALWLVGSPSAASSIHLKLREHQQDGVLFLSVEPVAESWWKTVQPCVPDPVPSLPAVEWQKLITNLITGTLIYPV